jgi:drug/metabolite transporter (DMT)-like permease
MTAITRAIGLFEALPGATRGIIWMIFATFCYAVLYAVVKHLTQDLHTIQIVFFRSSLGVLFMLPWLVRAGVGVLKTTRYGAYGVRAVLNYIGMVMLMWGLGNLALQDVTALMYTGPLFTVLFVVLFLHEKVGPRRVAALIVGFSGALIIIRPGVIPISLATIAIISTSACYALCNVATKSLGRTENSNAIVFYVFLLMMLIGLGPTIYVWETPALDLWPWIIAMGILSSLATQGVTRSLVVADAGLVMPFNFLKLPFAVVLGFTFWNEFPDLWTCVGAAVIFASTYYIARREAAARAAAKAAEIAKPVQPV